MTAVAMVAVMIVAAFAVVGMADSEAADTNKEKYIIGTTNNPYVLKINDTVTSSIEFNQTAFTERAQIDFAYKWLHKHGLDPTPPSNDYTSLAVNTTKTISVIDEEETACDELTISELIAL